MRPFQYRDSVLRVASRIAIPQRKQIKGEKYESPFISEKQRRIVCSVSGLDRHTVQFRR
jgi:hypothetical protein